MEASICPDPVSKKENNKNETGRTKYNIALPTLSIGVLHVPGRLTQPGPLRVGKVSRAPFPGTDPFRGRWTGIGGVDRV